MIKITVFSNDAGPSENIINVIKKFHNDYIWNILVYENSPANILFDKVNIQVDIIDKKTNLEKLLIKENPNILYITTSWQNKIHLSFIKLARRLNIKSLVSMDHWVNYRERFDYPNKGWQNNLPDFMSVNDTDAYKLAKSYGFKGVLPLKYYTLLNDFDKLETFDADELNQLLFISEPTKKVAKTLYNNENYWGFNEFEIVENICNNISLFKTNYLKIRLHPSDEAQKYDYINKKFPNLHIEIENPYENELLSSIVRARNIIGVDGVVLYKAKVLGKKVISFIPTSKRECTVPLFKENILKDIEIDLSICKKENSIETVKNFGLDFNEVVKKIQEKESLNAAVVGCGNIGGEYDSKDSYPILTHAHAYLKHTKTNLFACCDLDEKRLDTFKIKWNKNIKTYINIEQMIEKESLDIVSICTNTSSHYEILSLLLKKNIKYIICEKPFVSTIEQYESINKLLKDSTSRLIINYMRCFDPAILELKDMIDSKKLGNICSFNAQINKGLIHNGSHILSLVEMLVGDITSIKAINYEKSEDDFMGNFLINVDKVSGIVSTIKDLQYSTFFVNIYFDKAYIVISELGFNIEVFESMPSTVFKGANTLKLQKKLQNTLATYALNTLEFFLKNDTTDIMQKHLAFSKKMLLLEQRLNINAKEVYFEKM